MRRGILLAMMIYVDADACPYKDLIYRAAARYRLPLTVVANSGLRVPPEVTLVRVGNEPDAADDWIAGRVAKGDLVLTADIPLAARALAAGARCLDFRGGEFTSDRIGDALASRDLMRYLRDLGDPAALRGPSALTPRNRSRFVSILDATLNRIAREQA
ncbi:MAG: YaiI/YqxD family protein [Thermomicrobiales bacterium]